MHHRPFSFASSLTWGLLVVAALLSSGWQAPHHTDLQRAIEVQRDLLTTQPADSSAWNDLGNLLELAGDPQAAETAYLRALELKPSLVSAHFNLALLLHAEGRLTEALGHFEDVIALDNDHAWSYYHKGRIHQRRGQRNAAVDAYARAFAFDPRLSFADVNPHVLDNPLLTEALMRAASVDVQEDWTPRSYEDPARIAGLLAPPTPATATAEVEAAAADEDQGEAPPLETPTPEAPLSSPPLPTDSSTKTAPAPPAGEREGPPTADLAPRSRAREEPDTARTAPASRRLTPETLDSLETTNQASPPEEAAPTGGTRTRTVPPSSRPAPSVRQPAARESTPGASTQRPTSPRPRFTPGSRSSAQIERHVRPAGAAS